MWARASRSPRRPEPGTPALPSGHGPAAMSGASRFRAGCRWKIAAAGSRGDRSAGRAAQSPRREEFHGGAATSRDVPGFTGLCVNSVGFRASIRGTDGGRRRAEGGIRRDKAGFAGTRRDSPGQGGFPATKQIKPGHAGTPWDAAARAAARQEGESRGEEPSIPCCMARRFHARRALCTAPWCGAPDGLLPPQKTGGRSRNRPETTILVRNAGQCATVPPALRDGEGAA